MKVNGKITVLKSPLFLSVFLAEEGYDAAKVAVEKNGLIVPRAAFAATQLTDEDILEIVTFVGGG